MVSVDQRLVHRTRDDEVFLVDAEVAGDDMHASGAVPGSHSRMPRVDGPLPEIIVLEIFRQAGFFMAHQGVGMPFGWHLVTTRFGMDWQQQPPHVDAASTFLFNLNGQVSIRRRGPDPYYLGFTAELVAGDRAVAGGWVEAYCLAPHQYQALRRRSLTDTGASQRDSRNTAPEEERAESGWLVSWDAQDPFLFTRFGDHVVSMAMIETVLAVAGGRDDKHAPVSVDMEFSKFGEVSDPIILTPVDQDTRRRRWELHQTGEVIARARTNTDIPGELSASDRR